jgi:hypothetical protein
MQRFQRGLAIAVCAFVLSASSHAASEAVPSYKVFYSGGSMPGIKTGDGMSLYLDKLSVGFVHKKDTPFRSKPRPSQRSATARRFIGELARP